MLYKLYSCILEILQLLKYKQKDENNSTIP